MDLLNVVITTRVTPYLSASLSGFASEMCVMQGKGAPGVEMAGKAGSTISFLIKRFLCTQMVKIVLGKHIHIYKLKKSPDKNSFIRKSSNKNTCVNPRRLCAENRFRIFASKHFSNFIF